MEPYYIITVEVRGDTRYLHIDHKKELRIVGEREKAAKIGPELVPLYIAIVGMKFNVAGVGYEAI